MPVLSLTEQNRQVKYVAAIPTSTTNSESGRDEAASESVQVGALKKNRLKAVAREIMDSQSAAYNRHQGEDRQFARNARQALRSKDWESRDLASGKASNFLQDRADQVAESDDRRGGAANPHGLSYTPVEMPDGTVLDAASHKPRQRRTGHSGTSFLESRKSGHFNIDDAELNPLESLAALRRLFVYYSSLGDSFNFGYLTIGKWRMLCRECRVFTDSAFLKSHRVHVVEGTALVSPDGEDEERQRRYPVDWKFQGFRSGPPPYKEGGYAIKQFVGRTVMMHTGHSFDNPTMNLMGEGKEGVCSKVDVDLCYVKATGNIKKHMEYEQMFTGLQLIAHKRFPRPPEFEYQVMDMLLKKHILPFAPVFEFEVPYDEFADPGVTRAFEKRSDRNPDGMYTQIRDIYNFYLSIDDGRKSDWKSGSTHSKLLDKKAKDDAAAADGGGDGDWWADMEPGISLVVIMKFLEDFDLCPKYISKANTAKCFCATNMGKELGFDEFCDFVKRVALFIYGNFPFTDLAIYDTGPAKVSALFEIMGLLNGSNSMFKSRMKPFQGDRARPLHNVATVIREDEAAKVSEEARGLTGENAAGPSDAQIAWLRSLMFDAGKQRKEIRRVFRSYCASVDPACSDTMTQVCFVRFCRDCQCTRVRQKVEHDPLAFNVGGSTTLARLSSRSSLLDDSIEVPEFKALTVPELELLFTQVLKVKLGDDARSVSPRARWREIQRLGAFDARHSGGAHSGAVTTTTHGFSNNTGVKTPWDVVAPLGLQDGGDYGVLSTSSVSGRVGFGGALSGSPGGSVGPERFSDSQSANGGSPANANKAEWNMGHAKYGRGGTWTAKDVQPQKMAMSKQRDGHEDRRKPVFDFTHFCLALSELAYKMYGVEPVSVGNIIQNQDFAQYDSSGHSLREAEKLELVRGRTYQLKQDHMCPMSLFRKEDSSSTPYAGAASYEEGVAYWVRDVKVSGWNDSQWIQADHRTLELTLPMDAPDKLYLISTNVNVLFTSAHRAGKEEVTLEPLPGGQVGVKLNQQVHAVVWVGAVPNNIQQQGGFRPKASVAAVEEHVGGCVTLSNGYTFQNPDAEASYAVDIHVVSPPKDVDEDTRVLNLLLEHHLFEYSSIMASQRDNTNFDINELLRRGAGAVLDQHNSALTNIFTHYSLLDGFSAGLNNAVKVDMPIEAQCMSQKAYEQFCNEFEIMPRMLSKPECLRAFRATNKTAEMKFDAFKGELLVRLAEIKFTKHPYDKQLPTPEQRLREFLRRLDLDNVSRRGAWNAYVDAGKRETGFRF